MLNIYLCNCNHCRHLTFNISYFLQSPVYSEQNLIDKPDIIQVTLVRDPMGLGFSIAGGKGAEAYIEGSESVYISKIAEGGPASRDGKLQVGDRIVQVKFQSSCHFPESNSAGKIYSHFAFNFWSILR